KRPSTVSEQISGKYHSKMTLSPTSVFHHPAIIFHHCSMTNRLVLILMLMQPVHLHYTNFVIRNTIQKAPSKDEYFDSLPSSFAILINLGLDGNVRLSSNGIIF